MSGTISLYQVSDKISSWRPTVIRGMRGIFIRFLSAVYNFHEAAPVEAKYRAILDGKASMSGLNEKLWEKLRVCRSPESLSMENAFQLHYSPRARNRLNFSFVSFETSGQKFEAVRQPKGNNTYESSLRTCILLIFK